MDEPPTQLVGLLCGVSAPKCARVSLNFLGGSPTSNPSLFVGPGTNPCGSWDLCLVVRGGQQHDRDLPEIGTDVGVGLLVVGEGSSDAGDPPEVDPAKGQGTQLLLRPCTFAQLPQELPRGQQQWVLGSFHRLPITWVSSTHVSQLPYQTALVNRKQHDGWPSLFAPAQHLVSG